jgi:uncharacterized protein YjiS (DUF1127 family)
VILSHAGAHSPRPVSIGAATRSLWQAIRAPLLRATIARRLERLDERILADIGVNRWEIDAIAERAVARRTPGFRSALADLIAALAAGLKTWSQRRIAYRELMALDDRMLSDIGISRADIPEVIAAFDNGGAARSPADDRRIDGPAFADIDAVPEAVPFRRLPPANRNHAPRAA